MGIKDRISTAKFLIANGLPNDALILILVAIAASSRKKYSKAAIKYDGEAFKTFLNAGLKNILTHLIGGNADYIDGVKLTFSPEFIDVKRDEHTIEELIYEQYRCNFMHEGELPPEVMFTDESPPVREFIQANFYDGSSAHFGVTHDEKLVMSHNWLEALINIVEQHDINIDLFGPAPSHINEADIQAHFAGIPKIIFHGMAAR